MFINDFFCAIWHSQVSTLQMTTRSFACGETLDEETKSIVNDTRMAMKWLKLNEMVANLEKFN